MKHSHIRKLFSIPALALFAAVTFFTGCSELEAKKSTLTFRVTDEMAQKIQEAAYSHTIRNSRATRSALTENLVFSITLSGEYEETKTCPATAGQKITFEAVPVGAKITATAAAYIETAQASDSAEESDADRVILYTGMSEEYIILEGENSIPIKLIKTSNKFTITFDSNGGSEVTPISVEPGTAATQPASPLKEGYTFTNWYLGNDEYNWTKEVNGNLSLRAGWEAITYKVVFAANGGEGSMASLENVKYDTSFPLTKCTFTPPQGHKFAGWALSKDDNIRYNDQAVVTNLAATPDAVIHLYAVWTEITNHNITYYNVPDGIVNENPETFNESDDITLATLTDRTGYTFAGWYDNAELSGDSISGWDAGDKTDDVKLYAKWNAITYTVKFLNPNNEEELSTAQAFTYDIEEKLNASEITPPQGYKFTGWATSKSNEVTYASGQAVKNLASEDGAVVTLYAVWIENEAHSITYTLNLNEGETVSNTNVNSFKETQEVTLATLTGRTGYTFAGWYDNAELSGDSISGWDAGDKTDDVKLYAKWTLNEYTVTFNSMGGSTVNEQKVYYNQKITQPAPEPTREASGTMSYEFSGWYTSEDEGTTLSETAFNFDTPVTDNLTLYAKWTETITTVSISIELSVNTDKSDITVNKTREGNLYTYTVQNADNYTDFVWEIDGSTPPEEWAGVSGGTLIINATKLEPGWYDISLTAQDNSGKYYSFFGQLHVTKD